MVTFVDINDGFASNTIRRKACFSSGLTLKSDMLVNRMIDRWRTTLKLAVKGEYITQWCNCSLFVFWGEVVYEVYEGRSEEKGAELC